MCVCECVVCVCAVYLCEVNSILAIVVAASTICGRVQHTNTHTRTGIHTHTDTHTNTHQYVCPFQSSIKVFCYDFHTSCSPPQKPSRALCCCLCRCVCLSVCRSACLCEGRRCMCVCCVGVTVTQVDIYGVDNDSSNVQDSPSSNGSQSAWLTINHTPQFQFSVPSFSISFRCVLLNIYEYTKRTNAYSKPPPPSHSFIFPPTICISNEA